DGLLHFQWCGTLAMKERLAPRMSLKNEFLPMKTRWRACKRTMPAPWKFFSTAMLAWYSGLHEGLCAIPVKPRTWYKRRFSISIKNARSLTAQRAARRTGFCKSLCIVRWTRKSTWHAGVSILVQTWAHSTIHYWEG